LKEFQLIKVVVDDLTILKLLLKRIAFLLCLLDVLLEYLAASFAALREHPQQH